jgi:hypothetical protein
MIEELEQGLVQSSSVVGSEGQRLSNRDVDAAAWYDARLPATVLAVLVAHCVYPDPFAGMRALRRASATPEPRRR